MYKHTYFKLFPNNIYGMFELKVSFGFEFGFGEF